MGALDYLYERAAWAQPLAKPAAARAAGSQPRLPKFAPSQRDFSAAKTDRLTATWSGVEQTINQLLIRQLRAMRARSQQFCRDNPYGKRFLRMTQVNIVGHDGFALAYHCLRPDGSIDEYDSATMLRAWNRWERRGQCDVTGTMSFNTLTKQIIMAVARDGEVFVRKVSGKDRGIHRFQLQLLPAFIVNEQHNADLGGGYTIRMGIELDPFGKPIAYHIRRAAPVLNIWATATTFDTERVPADEIYHLFHAEEPGQLRGYPWTVTVLRQAHHLETYDEAAIVAANVGAAKMGFYKSQDGDAGPVADAQEGETAAGAGDFLTDAEPGHFSMLPPGWEFQEFNPDYPHQNYNPFVEAQLRRMSTGLDASYASLSADRSTENFSSIRTGSLDEREVWKSMQGWLIEDFLERVSADWLTRAMLVDVELAQLPAAKFDKFNAPHWQGRRWDWVDPKSDADAAAVEVALGTRSRASIIREKGGEPSKVWAELKIEENMGFTAPHLGGGGAQQSNNNNGGSNGQP